MELDFEPRCQYLFWIQLLVLLTWFFLFCWLVSENLSILHLHVVSVIDLHFSLMELDKCQHLFWIQLDKHFLIYKIPSEYHFKFRNFKMCMTCWSKHTRVSWRLCANCRKLFLNDSVKSAINKLCFIKLTNGCINVFLSENIHIVGAVSKLFL